MRCNTILQNDARLWRSHYRRPSIPWRNKRKKANSFENSFGGQIAVCSCFDFVPLGKKKTFEIPQCKPSIKAQLVVVENEPVESKECSNCNRAMLQQSNLDFPHRDRHLPTVIGSPVWIVRVAQTTDKERINASTNSHLRHFVLTCSRAWYNRNNTRRGSPFR